GHFVLALGNGELAVPELRRRTAEVHRALVLVEQSPNTDAAVDDVLSEIARVVPAAAHIERVVAAGVLPARHALVRQVPRRTRPLLSARPRLLDRNAAAIPIEVGERV